MNKDYIFNTLAGLINAAEAVIMSMIITRTTGLTDAGYVTIAFAVGNLLITIGKYGVYGFQVTDNKQEFTFRTYKQTRFITTTLMLLSLSVYLIYGKYILAYTYDKILIVLFIGLIYAIESIEDLLHAHCQYKGELYLGSLFFIIRWLSIMISFGIAVYCTKNTALALGISLSLSVLVFLVCCFVFKYRYINTNNLSDIINSTSDKPICLLMKCFPLFLSSFLSFYIINSPKYALERYMDAATQACYGFVAMPVFAIGLLNGFIYVPQLVSISADYNGHNISQFNKRIIRQYIIIFLLTLICLFGAYLIGIPVLGLLYHTDLQNYKNELLILILGGGFLALSGYQGAILTIMRRQKFQLYGYIPVAILAILFENVTVKNYGTIGAAFSYLVLITLLCILYEFFIRTKQNN